MHFILEPNIGAGQLKFGMERREVRNILPSKPLIKPNEPENDFYEIEGLILGYDDIDQLEYIEIIRPSTVEYAGIDFYSLNLDDCIAEMKKRGLKAPFDDGGYNFSPRGIAFFSPDETLESVSLYREGYYDDL